MIKPFEFSDLGYFIPNEFSDPARVIDVLADPSITKYTQWHDGMVSSILVYHEYHDRCWAGFFLVAQQPPLRAAMELKQYIEGTMERHNAIRLQTDSIACDILDKWHEYLGFKFEGCREKMMFGRDYHMWARMRDGGA